METRIGSHDDSFRELRETMATKEQVEGIGQLVSHRLEAHCRKVTATIEGITLRCGERAHACQAQFTRGDEALGSVRVQLRDEVFPKLQTAELDQAVAKTTISFWGKIILVLLGASVAGGGVVVGLLKLAGQFSGTP